jgi:ABC-2 type transport system permease protein
MTNIKTIFRRELSAYLNSPIAYVVVAAYLILSGALFFSTLFLQQQASLRGFFELAPLLLFLMVPLITMGLLAEERQQGTFELLLTMPVTDWQVVLGKWLAACGLIFVLILASLPFAVVVAWVGPLDKGATLTGYIGMLMMGSTYAAVGVMASSFTKNQIIAALVALFIGFLLFILSRLTPLAGPTVGAIVSGLSIDAHFQNAARGVLDTRDIIYYASMSGGCLLVGVTTLSARRWA